MVFVGGTPPGPHAGDILPLTEVLRPRLRLIARQCQTARRLRRSGWEVAEIAERFGVEEEEIRLALATMRTQNSAPTRGTLNVTIEAHDFVVGEAISDEPYWETVDRLMAELAFRRAMSGVPASKEPYR